MFDHALADSRQFLNVPSYLAVFANRPFEDITTPDLRRSLQLGLDHVMLTQRVGTDYADVVASDPFRRAFIRLRAEHGLYRQNTAAITFLTPTLFRTAHGTPYNVLFRGPEPVFVDVLSFECREGGDPTWLPYAQFVRTFLLPRSDFEILDTWRSVGLRGTCSNDAEVPQPAHGRG